MSWEKMGDEMSWSAIFYGMKRIMPLTPNPFTPARQTNFAEPASGATLPSSKPKTSVVVGHRGA